jgi:hypothetical protein
MFPPRLEDQTVETFTALKGTSSFRCQFPDGRLYTVKVHTHWNSRTKIRHAYFDIFSTDWAFKRDANSPGDKSTRLKVSCPSEQFGAEMQKAVRSLPALLMPLPSLQEMAAGHS